MKVINLNELKSNIKIDNLVIGHFNVIHNGHLKLFKNLNNFSFLIFQDNPSKKYNLYNIEERIKNLEYFKPEYVIVFNIFSDNCSATQFIDNYLKKYLTINKIYVGSDYHFGKDKSGDVNTLKQYFDVSIINNTNDYSTKKIVEMLELGEVENANKWMPIKFYYSGVVTKGKGIASKSFFPTANIIDNKNINIRNGSYVSQTYFNNKVYPSISFIGIPKSLESAHKFVETYIFDFDQDLYGKTLKVEILKFIRDNQKFNSIDELILNINNDLKIAKQYFKK